MMHQNVPQTKTSECLARDIKPFPVQVDDEGTYFHGHTGEATKLLEESQYEEPAYIVSMNGSTPDLIFPESHLRAIDYE